MLVPETTMHKNHFAPPPEYDIRLTRQVLCVKPIPVTERIEQPSNHHFRSHPLAPDVTHYFATALRAYPVQEPQQPVLGIWLLTISTLRVDLQMLLDAPE